MITTGEEEKQGCGYNEQFGSRQEVGRDAAIMPLVWDMLNMKFQLETAVELSSRQTRAESRESLNLGPYVCTEVC